MVKHKADPYRRLIVRLSGAPIGTITRVPGERHFFAFDESYLQDPNRLTLSLSYKSQSGGLVTAIRPYSLRLPPFFSNLLPEGHLRDYLAARAGVKSEREFFLLAALGQDLPGAVTVHPEGLEPHESVEEDKLTTEGAAPGNMPAMRFSLAGVQLKFSAIMQAAGGLTVPANGEGGNWIVKLPSVRFSVVPENEFVMLELARRVGIEVPNAELVAMDAIEGLPDEVRMLSGKALIVQRFDRSSDDKSGKATKPGESGRRIHMEDFAQVFGLFAADKYEKRSYANIASVLAAEVGQAAVIDFMRRLTFSIMIGNADMHLKNWSLLYPDGRQPKLAPAYDYVCTLPYLPNQQLALGFGKSKATDNITPEQVRRFAETAKLSTPVLWQTVIATIEETRLAWQDHSVRDLLPRNIMEIIQTHMETVARNVALSCPR